MSNQKWIIGCIFMGIIIQLALGQAPCPVEEDPVQLAECAQLDVQAIIQAARGNLKLFCNLAERYMECFKTKTRNCIGGWVRRKFIQVFNRSHLSIFRQRKVVLLNYKIWHNGVVSILVNLNRMNVHFIVI
jgi:hypothetical protein